MPIRFCSQKLLGQTKVCRKTVTVTLMNFFQYSYVKKPLDLGRKNRFDIRFHLGFP